MSAWQIPSSGSGEAEIQTDPLPILKGSAMRYYRCYFLTANNHIAKAVVLKCADDDGAKRQCHEVFVDHSHFFGAEIWDGARRVYSFPDEIAAIARGRRRKGEVRERDEAIVDALNAQIAKDRHARLVAEAIQGARLREQRLERDAAQLLASKRT
jgi:hypothetical protein